MAPNRSIGRSGHSSGCVAVRASHRGLGKVLLGRRSRCGLAEPRVRVPHLSSYGAGPAERGVRGRTLRVRRDKGLTDPLGLGVPPLSKGEADPAGVHDRRLGCFGRRPLDELGRLVELTRVRTEPRVGAEVVNIGRRERERIEDGALGTWQVAEVAKGLTELAEQLGFRPCLPRGPPGRPAPRPTSARACSAPRPAGRTPRGSSLRRPTAHDSSLQRVGRPVGHE